MVVKVKAAPEADEVVTQPAQRGRGPVVAMVQPWLSCRGFGVGSLGHTLQTSRQSEPPPLQSPDLSEKLVVVPESRSSSGSAIKA